ncbi:MAG: carotenoid oxygenase family protein, partial [Fibrobacteria bacterium]
VPRSGGREGEGEGFLLSLVYRKETGTSDLLILDAARIDAGPIAVVRIPHRVPFGFHGSWVGEEEGTVPRE